MVHKLRLQVEEGGWSKIWKNCKLYSIKSQTIRWVGGQKSLKLANVICEHPSHSEMNESWGLYEHCKSYLVHPEFKISLQKVYVH